MNFLSGIENLFAQFFAFSQARETDAYFPLRLAGTPNQAMRQVHNSDWLPHVQYQRVTSITNRKCLENQGNRFACGHEKSSDFGMGNVEWLIPAKLFLEQRHHAAIRPQHIAKPHR